MWQVVHAHLGLLNRSNIVKKSARTSVTRPRTNQTSCQGTSFMRRVVSITAAQRLNSSLHSGELVKRIHPPLNYHCRPIVIHIIPSPAHKKSSFMRQENPPVLWSLGPKLHISIHFIRSENTLCISEIKY